MVLAVRGANSLAASIITGAQSNLIITWSTRSSIFLKNITDESYWKSISSVSTYCVLILHLWWCIISTPLVEWPWRRDSAGSETKHSFALQTVQAGRLYRQGGPQVPWGGEEASHRGALLFHNLVTPNYILRSSSMIILAKMRFDSKIPQACTIDWRKTSMSTLFGSNKA